MLYLNSSMPSTSNQDPFNHPRGGLFLEKEHPLTELDGMIQNMSWKFFDAYHDLLPEHHGLIWQGQHSWLGGVGQCTLYFTAQDHVANWDARTDGNGSPRAFHGTSIFGWQMIQASEVGRRVLSVTTRDPWYISARRTQYDAAGSIRVSELPGEDEVHDMYKNIQGILNDPNFAFTVKQLRQRRSQAITQLCDLLLHQHEHSAREFMLNRKKQEELIAKAAFCALAPSVLS